MAWICPSCGFENSDNSLIKCVCGHELNTNSHQEVTAKKVSKTIQLLLLIIGLGGLSVGYIFIPIIALSIELILILLAFVPFGNNN